LRDRRTVAEIISEIIAKTSDVFQIFSDEIAKFSDVLHAILVEIERQTLIKYEFFNDALRFSRNLIFEIPLY
jgi:hypothetical protein